VTLGPLLAGEGLQVRREVRTPPGDAELAADVGAVERYRRAAHVQGLGDLGACLTLAHERRYGRGRI